MSEKDKKADKGEFPTETKILHHRSPHFSSQYAGNTVVAGPSGDGLYHLIFNTDVIGIQHETAELIEPTGDVTEDGYLKAAYKSKINRDDLEYFREDVARITMPLSSLLRLRDVLNQLFPAKTDGTSENGGN